MSPSISASSVTPVAMIEKRFISNLIVMANIRTVLHGPNFPVQPRMFPGKCLTFSNVRIPNLYQNVIIHFVFSYFLYVVIRTVQNVFSVAYIVYVYQCTCGENVENTDVLHTTWAYDLKIRFNII